MKDEADSMVMRRRRIPPGIGDPRPDERGLTVAEFAKRQRVSEITVRRWIREGMPTVQPGGFRGRHLIYDSQVRQWANEFRCIGAPPDHSVSAKLEQETRGTAAGAAETDEAVS